MNLDTTKSQTIALMAQELSAIQQQCEDYQQAVEKLSKQVRSLAVLVNQADHRSTKREKQLSNQLAKLQTTLKLLPCE